MDQIKSEVIKTLFRSSNDREQLMRSVEELQNDAGRSSPEDAMEIIIDGFLSYVRVLEKKVHEEIENGISEGLRTANQDLKKSLSASQQILDEDPVETEMQEVHKATVKETLLFGQNRELYRQKQGLERQNADLQKRMNASQIDYQHLTEELHDRESTLEVFACRIEGLEARLKDTKDLLKESKVINAQQLETINLYNHKSDAGMLKRDFINPKKGSLTITLSRIPANARPISWNKNQLHDAQENRLPFFQIFARENHGLVLDLIAYLYRVRNNLDAQTIESLTKVEIICFDANVHKALHYEQE
ncbi:MAG: hypothetical protein Q9170_002434 [Blastenia crenularia]